MRSVSNSGAADPLKVSKFLDFLRYCNRGAEKSVYKEELE